MSEQIKPKPNITLTPDGPYLVKDLENFANQSGPIETKKTLALCRCGGSANKPFCDGTHAKIGFSSAKLDGTKTCCNIALILHYFHVTSLP